jgi:hypothetical protein
LQLSLPIEDEDDADAAPAAVLSAPGLDDPREERRVLASLAERAASAEPHDSKRRALQRILRRVREPAIVFTEYRDTLESLRAATGADTAVLHGGMDRFERAKAVREFTSGRARVLLATDTAGEGLNLQPRCRLVINLELPWNPMRLEQRVGRVDRIGQRRTVHAINLLASGTPESDMLARLALRLDRARRSLGPVDDVLGLGEEAVMAACLGADGRTSAFAARPRSNTPPSVLQSVLRFDLADAARDEAARLERLRQLFQASEVRRRRAHAGSSPRRAGGIAVSTVRRSRLTLADGRTGLLVVFRIRFGATVGKVPDEDLVPVFAESPCARMPRRRVVRSAAASAMRTIVPRMAACIAQREPCIARDDAAFDRDTLLAARSRARGPVQRGLFDRRTLREAEPDVREAGRPARAARGNERTAEPGAAPAPQPVLLLFVTS